MDKDEAGEGFRIDDGELVEVLLHGELAASGHVLPKPKTALWTVGRMKQPISAQGKLNLELV